MDDQSLDLLLQSFENGTWPIADWKHAQHLMVAACYIMEGNDALNRLRTGIPRYNVSQGGQNTRDSGYHETLTCFWYEVVRAFLASLPAGLNRPEKVARVVEEFAPRRDLFRHYYDFDVVKSREARAVWIAPSRALPVPVPQPPEQSQSIVPA